MNTNEFLNFIAPQLEPLQMSFFILILAMFFGTVISTHLNARDSSWRKNWSNGTTDDRSDDLDIDHGSVTDLWHAVATKSEKLAEVMPGMLLVVGLLGTFLGLGLALNHASNILGQSNTLSSSGAANNMQDLMSMMQGLGTKFKTSTWGITFFLLLKVWSSWLGFEEKRLAWVIRKVKTELEHRKVQEQDEGINKQKMLFEQIINAASQIVQGFTQNVKTLSDSQKELHLQTLQFVKSGIQVLHKDLAGISINAENDAAMMKLVLEQSVQGVREDLSHINTANQNSSASTKQALEQSTQDIRHDLASINTATQTSSEAMVGFVKSTQTIIQDMSTASEKMAEGAQKVGVAGTSLVKAVDDFSSQFTQVLGDVRTDLSTAINNMSEQAAQTLEQGTKELGKATLEISTALGVLSKDVTTTMNGVKDSIVKSLKIQEEGAILFRNSSDALNVNVTATTQLIGKVSEDIGSGLVAVSVAGRRMVHIGNSLETIVPQMEDLLPALEPLKTLHTQNQPLLDEARALRTDFLTLGEDIRSSLQHVPDTSLLMASMDKSLLPVLREMRDLRKDVSALPQAESQAKSNIYAQA